MALSTCVPVSTDPNGRDQIKHGTALFPVACYHDDLHRFGVEWHWHEELEVFTVETGTARASVPGADYIIKQGEGFLSTRVSFMGSGRMVQSPATCIPSCSIRVISEAVQTTSSGRNIWNRFLQVLPVPASTLQVYRRSLSAQSIGHGSFVPARRKDTSSVSGISFRRSFCSLPKISLLPQKSPQQKR